MRYAIYVNDISRKARTLDEALGLMAGLMRIDRADVRAQLEASGTARAITSRKVGSIEDRHWVETSPASIEDRARNKVRQLYGEDGVLEVDEGDPVSRGDGCLQVRVWVWVYDSDAGITGEEQSDAERESKYIRAACHPVADIDIDASVSMGEEPGAYVSGWVCISDCEEPTL